MVFIFSFSSNLTSIFSLDARRRVNDGEYDFVDPDLSVGQVLLFDENTPVQVTGVTDIGGLSVRVRNLVEGWTCWVPFFSINFLRNRECYQQISDERCLFKGRLKILLIRTEKQFRF